MPADPLLEYDGPVEAIRPEPDQAPTGSLRALAARGAGGDETATGNARALDELAAAGWGEGDTDDHHVPPGLVELHEILDWQAAVERAEGAPS